MAGGVGAVAEPATVPGEGEASSPSPPGAAASAAPSPSSSSSSPSSSTATASSSKSYQAMKRVEAWEVAASVNETSAVWDKMPRGCATRSGGDACIK